MCMVKVFEGMNKYNDINSYYDILRYVLDSPYCDGIWIGNLEENQNIGAIANQFRSVEKIRFDLDGKTRVHHFVLCMEDANMRYEAIVDLGRNVRDYFKKRNFHVVVGIHRGSKNNPCFTHLHVVVNHCSRSGKLFYGTDEDYGMFVGYLKKVTHNYNWHFIYASDADYSYRSQINLEDYGCIL